MGDFLLDGSRVKHDKNCRFWRMYLDYNWFYDFSILRGEGALEPPLMQLEGEWFWVQRGVVHDYTCKLWSL